MTTRKVAKALVAAGYLGKADMVHAYTEAAASLVAAGLIDPSKASDAAAIIAETWELGR